jgi:hypothetical protein
MEWCLTLRFTTRLEDQEPYAGQRNYLDVVRSGSGLG